MRDRPAEARQAKPEKRRKYFGDVAARRGNGSAGIIPPAAHLASLAFGRHSMRPASVMSCAAAQAFRLCTGRKGCAPPQHECSRQRRHFAVFFPRYLHIWWNILLFFP